MGRRAGVMTDETAAQVDREFTQEQTRAVEIHKVAGELNVCDVEAVGDTGLNGANAKYLVGGMVVELLPQGKITDEALIAVVIDRLAGIAANGGCGDYNVALNHFREGLKAMRRQTQFLMAMKPRV